MAPDGAWLTPDLLSPRLRQAAAASVPEKGVQRPESSSIADGMDTGGTLKDQLERVEAGMLKAALDRCRGNRSRMARELGLSRVGLRAKLRRVGLDETAEAAE